MSIHLKKGETELVINHLEKAEKELEAVRKILSGTFETKNKGTPSSTDKEVSENEAIKLDIDVSGIQFKQKAGILAGPYAKWGWSFAYQQNGAYQDESRNLVQAIEQYENVRVGNRVYTLGGREGNLLNFKEAKS